MFDNYNRYEQKERDDDRWLRSRPRCCMCGSRIQEETALYLKGWICEDCIAENRRTIDDNE